jgi:hypothetical protein
MKAILVSTETPQESKYLLKILGKRNFVWQNHKKVTAKHYLANRSGLVYYIYEDGTVSYKDLRNIDEGEKVISIQEYLGNKSPGDMV